jgi:uncharacterized protein (TIGR01244 family)
MQTPVFITPTIAVTGPLETDDFAEIARLGFKSVVNNRPDGEEDRQLTARSEAVLAWRAGLAYRHVPSTKHQVLENDTVEATADALSELPGPILLHCKSGQRSAILWAAASVFGGFPLECALAAARAAGFEFAPLSEEIAAHAGRKRWLGASPTLDCDPERLAA